MSAAPHLLLAVLITALPWAVGRRFGMIPWVSPMHLVAIFAGLGVLLKTLFYAISPETAFYWTFVQRPAEVTAGYAYVLFYVLALCCGYALAAWRHRRLDVAAARTYLARFPRDGLTLAVGVLGFAAVTAALVSARGFTGLSLEAIHLLNAQKIERIDGVDGFGRSYAALKALYVVAIAAFVLLAARLAVAPGRLRAAGTAALALVLVFAAVLQGNRMELADILVFYLAAVVLAGGRIDARRVGALALGAAAVAAVFGVLTTLRATAGDLADAEFGLARAAGQIVGSTYFLDINVPVILADMEDLPEPLGGSSYLVWTYGWVPRAIWPEKPVVSVGPYLKTLLFGPAGIGGINPTGPGEAFLNFRWAGALCGLALGAAYRGIEVLLLGRRGILERHGLVLYPVLGYSAVLGTLQSSFSGTLVTCAAQALLLLALLGGMERLGRRRRPRAIAAGGAAAHGSMAR